MIRGNYKGWLATCPECGYRGKHIVDEVCQQPRLDILTVRCECCETRWEVSRDVEKS